MKSLPIDPNTVPSIAGIIGKKTTALQTKLTFLFYWNTGVNEFIEMLMVASKYFLEVWRDMDITFTHVSRRVADSANH